MTNKWTQFWLDPKVLQTTEKFIVFAKRREKVARKIAIQLHKQIAKWSVLKV